MLNERASKTLPLFWMLQPHNLAEGFNLEKAEA